MTPAPLPVGVVQKASLAKVQGGVRLRHVPNVVAETG